MHRIAQHLLDRSVRPARLVILAAAGGEPEHLPVRRPVAGSAESLRIHEGLQKIDRVTVHGFPVRRYPCCHAAENMRRQVFYPHPRQDQESCVVSEEANVLPACLTAPADVEITTAYVTRRRRPRQARNRSALRPYEVFQV